jgi:hypothetical protein
MHTVATGGPAQGATAVATAAASAMPVDTEATNAILPPALPADTVHPISIQTYSADYRNAAGGTKLAGNRSLVDQVADLSTFIIRDALAHGVNVFRVRSWFEKFEQMSDWRRAHWNGVEKHGGTFRLEAAFITSNNTPPAAIMTSAVTLGLQRLLAYPAVVVARYSKTVIDTQSVFANAARRVFRTFTRSEELAAACMVVRRLAVYAKVASTGFVGTTLNEFFQPQLAQLSNRMHMLLRQPHPAILDALQMTPGDLDESAQQGLGRALPSQNISNDLVNMFEGYGEPPEALVQNVIARLPTDPSKRVFSVHDRDCGDTDYVACSHPHCLEPFKFETRADLGAHCAKYPGHETGASTAYVNIRDQTYIEAEQKALSGLDPYQQKVVADGTTRTAGILLMGAAGYGKTTASYHLQRVLKKRFGPSHVTVTACTGQAAEGASLLGGQTLQSAFGLGLFQGMLVPQLVRNILDNSKAVECIRRTRVLVIEEAGMLSARMLDALEQVCRLIRGCPRQLMGGIMIVAILDPLQNRPFNSLPGLYETLSPDLRLPLGYANCFHAVFHPSGWNRLIIPHRQTDPTQLQDLWQFRYGLGDGNLLIKATTQV